MPEQPDIFGDIPKPKKSYRAIRHDVVRKRQGINCVSAHHPIEKINQIEAILQGKSNLKICELFAGQGNLTYAYSTHGDVTALDKKLGTGDSYLKFHEFISQKKKFDVVDADPYGFPSRLFPDIFLLIREGYLFVTLPIASVNILHDITKTHLYAYYGDESPSIETMIERIALWGLCHWRQVELLSLVKIDRMYRAAFSVKRIKATEYTGVRNR